MNEGTIVRSIFKAYDVRGVVDDALTESAVYRIGHALGAEACERGLGAVVVGRDGRVSGERLLNALAQGIIQAGVDVIDVGMVPTPVVYFATRYLGTGSGVAVTGSHNPPQHNGLKMMLAGETLHGERIVGLYDRIVADSMYTASHKGRVMQANVLPAYVDAIQKDVQLARPMKIAIDCGNGVGGVAAMEVFTRLGCDVTPLFCEVDGTFPNHHPDPADPHNLIDLQKILHDGDAEVGLAFDGDADRLGVVTKDGQIIYADRLIMLFAQDILKNHQDAQVIFDAKCSAHLSPWIVASGGRPVMWKTGHSLMKAKLRELGRDAVFAGEMSGHFYFNDRWAGFDDGLYAGARLLEILSRCASINPDETLSGHANGRVSERLNGLPQGLSTPEINLHIKEGEGVSLVQAFKAHAAFDAQLNAVDGLRYDFVDGFGLIRASNTTAVVVLRFEANDEVALKRIQSAFRDVLRLIAPTLHVPF
ncbi:Phosphomannomutase/phosphoglucomutase [Ephemeroptericola cinctiostellae]|uniref:Phosphomannomutase/phosphoglucomutase n=1 Tax=Ephemeroptericola cinctiostellae TaxID=2268024 RepID=A0A345D914_9BURK|nr:phosphomannomutase/phosphoglucomutase [Ephemeroptericola cinctiostellae]AXF84852.1 Phosphomannomutase/phosphoglucomutase [Ephemeroptericola cinctiostellae]